MNRDKLFVHHHVGLGDSLICNSILVWLDKFTSYEEIHLPVLSQNMINVSYMYRDKPRIKIIKIENDKAGRDLIPIYQEKEDFKILLLGNGLNPSVPPIEYCLSHYPNGEIFWDHLFFFHANLCIDVRYEFFNVKRDKEREDELKKKYKINPGDEYIFIQDDVSRGFEIDYRRIQNENDLRVIHMDIDRTDVIFDYFGIIESAKQVHVIDSAMLCMCDSAVKFLNLQESTRLFYHRYPRLGKGCEPTFSDVWQVIN